jgi:hypothetical protein
MKMMKTKFSIKTGVIVLIGLFFIFIFVYNLGKTLEGYEDKDSKEEEEDKKENKKEDKNVKEAAEGADSTTNSGATSDGNSKKESTTSDSQVDKETLKFIVDKMLK